MQMLLGRSIQKLLKLLGLKTLNSQFQFSYSLIIVFTIGMIFAINQSMNFHIDRVILTAKAEADIERAVIQSQLLQSKENAAAQSTHYFQAATAAIAMVKYGNGNGNDNDIKKATNPALIETLTTLEQNIAFLKTLTQEQFNTPTEKQAQAIV